LESYLAWVREQPPALYERLNGARVEVWLEALRAGRNPFDAATLAELR
jgi:hypothetical protein